MLACLGKLLECRPEPKWILNSSAPGPITVVDWITTAPRNPLINSFELPSTGYGSALYGNAKMAPPFSFELNGYRYTPRDMSMTDGVVASAAFFDDNQSLLSEQPTRFVVGLVQYLLTLTWFTEIPNYNAKRTDRVARNVTPYPKCRSVTVGAPPGGGVCLLWVDAGLSCRGLRDLMTPVDKHLLSSARRSPNYIA